MLEEAGRSTPGMRGGQMSCASLEVNGPTVVTLAVEPGGFPAGAWAYPLVQGIPQGAGP
jgi:hypothetical protein